MPPIISVEHLYKQYRLGTINHGMLRKDLQSWWARVRGKEDPNVRLVGSMSDGASLLAPIGDRFWALEDVSFEVQQGEVLGIIGRNGAGKTTLLKILSKVTSPTRGEIRLKGRVASLLEVGTGFHPELTGKENIFLNGAILGMTKEEIKEKFDEIVDFAEIEKFLDTPVKRYSSGMYVRLAFAVAAHLEPEILIVDEVLAVGDSAFQKKCLGKMSNVAKGGRTILFVSHNMAAIAQLTERCLVLDAGVADFHGATADALRHYNDKKKGSRQRGRVPIGRLDCDYQWLASPSLRILELGLAEGQSEEIDIGGRLRIEVLLESVSSFENIRLGYSVNDYTGRSILGGFSPGFNITDRGRHLIELSINNLSLAPGSYSLSIGLGTGGIQESKYEYHVVIGFGHVIVKSVWNNLNIAEWNRNWGSLVHMDSCIRKHACPT
jgi:lipopolysaccharide transport system ATP-binding protein